MLHTRVRAAVAAAGLISSGLISSGLLAAGPLPVTTAEAAAPRGDQATAVQVSISAKRVISMPTALRPGVTEFAVSSAKESSFQLITIAGDYPLTQLAADVNAGFGHNDVKAIKRVEAHVTFLGGIGSAPGHAEKVWLDVPAGAVYAVDTDAHTTMASKIVALTVAGEPTGAAFPSSKKLKAVSEVQWATNPTSIPVKGVLRFKNTASHNHFLDMIKLAKGKTMKDFKNWVVAASQGKQTPPPVDESAPQALTGVLSPGQSLSFHYRLTKGTYVMTCWWPDADMGGMPHVFMGMYRGITVR